MTVIVPDRCRYCRCGGESCGLPNGEKCCWYDKSRTVCSAPGCVRQYESGRREAQRAARPPRLSSADVNALIRGRGRKRKKGRAA